MYIRLYAKYPFLSDVKQNCISSIRFEKYSNITSDEYLSSGSRVVPCGRTHGQTRRKLIVAFRDFGNAPKKTERTGILMLSAPIYDNETGSLDVKRAGITQLIQ
jgi:hypothetical protein